MIRLALVDDHTSYREALAFACQLDPEIDVVAQVGRAAEAVLAVAGAEVMLVDLDLPDRSGIDLIPDLLQANPQCKPVVLTASTNATDFARAVEAGAVGVLPKFSALRDIITSVHRAHTDEPLHSPQELQQMFRLARLDREHERSASDRLQRLTEREREVLQLLADGLSDPQIGGRLHISVETVRKHINNVLSKLEVHSRLQAVLFMVRYRVIQLH